MNVYAVALFIHFLGLIILFSAFVLHARGDSQLRRATSMEQARECIALLKASGPMFPTGSIMLLLSGAYMSSARWSFSTPWVAVGIAGLIVMSVVGGIVGGRHGRSLAVFYNDPTRGPITPGLALVIHPGRADRGDHNGCRLGYDPDWTATFQPSNSARYALILDQY